MTSTVTKLQFLHRQILVSLSDGTAPWPLRIHPAVQGHFEALTAEVEHLRPEAQEIAVLRLQAERAGENPKDFLAGMVSKIEALSDELEAARVSGAAQIADKNRAVALAGAEGRRGAFRTAVKILREHCQQCPVEAATVLGPITSKLEDQATMMEAQAARVA